MKVYVACYIATVALTVDIGARGCTYIGVLCALCLYAQRQDFISIMSLYIKGRFFTILVIKYLMTSFYATATAVKCNMISTLNALHTCKGKILCQPINL